MQDLRPRIERNETNGLSQAEEVRDQVYDLFSKAADGLGVNVLILKSPPFTAPPWVSVECWIPHADDAALTLRSRAELTMRPREFHRFPIEIDLVIGDQKGSRKWSAITDFEAVNAERVLDYVIDKSKPRAFALRRCRVWPFQFWRPRNKPVRLGIDWAQIAANVLMILGFFTLGMAGIGVLLLLLGVVITFANRRRRVHILSAGKPAQEPRSLIRMDSWQTLVRDLGSARDAVISAIQEELQQVKEEGFLLGRERIWYWGVDGKEEREQLVVRFRRGLAFVHTYSYGKDLYVGWDAHVNCGSWIEQTSGTGHDKTTGELCAVHTIAAGWHAPNEYDMTDTNCLLERVHAAVSKAVRLKLTEHRIDQEIDFKILREQRQNIVGRGPSGGVVGGIRKAVSRFRRVA